MTRAVRWRPVRGRDDSTGIAGSFLLALTIREGGRMLAASLTWCGGLAIRRFRRVERRASGLPVADATVCCRLPA